VIEEYNLSVERRLRSGDLRHIAIMSMMLEGYDRVQIERMAGHFDVGTQYSYNSNSHFWFNLEIQYLVNQFKYQNKKSFISTDAIEIFDGLIKSSSYKKILNPIVDNTDFTKLEIGHCMDPNMACPNFNFNFTGCYICPSWGVETQDLIENKNLILKELTQMYNDL